MTAFIGCYDQAQGPAHGLGGKTSDLKARTRFAGAAKQPSDLDGSSQRVPLFSGAPPFVPRQQHGTRRSPLSSKTRPARGSASSAAMASPWSGAQSWAFATPHAVVYVPMVVPLLGQAVADNTIYDERLQEDVYLSMSMKDSGVPPRMFSRTPSPDSFRCYDEAVQQQQQKQQQQQQPSTKGVGQLLALAGHKFVWPSRPEGPQMQRPVPGAPLASKDAAGGGLSQLLRSSTRRLPFQEDASDADGSVSQQGSDTQSLPVKGTFIHFDEGATGPPVKKLTRANSAPAVIQSTHASKKGTGVHGSVQCQPCAYYWYKADGCRNAESCKFCHVCPYGEIQKRKKERRAMKKAFYERARRGEMRGP